MSSVSHLHLPPEQTFIVVQSRSGCPVPARPVYNRPMLAHVRTSLVLAPIALLAACAAGPPDAGSLQDSFAAQIAAVGGVSDFERDGTELTFSGPDGAGGQAAWQVGIDSVVVAPQDDEALPVPRQHPVLLACERRVGRAGGLHVQSSVRFPGRGHRAGLLGPVVGGGGPVDLVAAAAARPHAPEVVAQVAYVGRNPARIGLE